MTAGVGKSAGLLWQRGRITHTGRQNFSYQYTVSHVIHILINYVGAEGDYVVITFCLITIKRFGEQSISLGTGSK